MLGLECVGVESVEEKKVDGLHIERYDTVQNPDGSASGSNEASNSTESRTSLEAGAVVGKCGTCSTCCKVQTRISALVMSGEP